MKQPQNDHEILGIFSTPIYITKRDLITIEEKEIEDIIQEEMYQDGPLDYHTNNSYIFDTKLKNLKEFCEEHIREYIKEIIIPKNEELEFYITQSWLNVLKPGGTIKTHSHENSIISGAFYLTVEEDDEITFIDPHWKYKRNVDIQHKEYNMWNSTSWTVPVDNNTLLLFPSWLEHAVLQNEKATTDRISISFNIFVRGTIGNERVLTELILL